MSSAMMSVLGGLSTNERDSGTKGILVKKDKNGFPLFPFRFFLLCSGCLEHTGHGLIVDLCALLRIFVQGRLQALAGEV